jgi:hypothetical protein
MQSAPHEAPQTATSLGTSQDPTSPPQHGLPDRDEPASGHLPAGAGELRSTTAADSDALSIASSTTSRGRRLDERRLSDRDDSSHSSSPGSRIDDYERKHAKPRKRSDGMIFQVVPNKDKGKEGNVGIEEFPNGMHTQSTLFASTDPSRGTHSHPLSFATRDPLFDESRLSPLPPNGHHSAGVENRICSLLPRCRIHQQWQYADSWR